MTRRSLSFAFVAVLLAGAMAAAQAHAPVVTMSVTTPDGRTHELTAAEGGLGTLTLKDGTEYGFRPTIQDSSPWNRIVVTIFRSATASAPTTVLGEIELRRRTGSGFENESVLQCAAGQVSGRLRAQFRAQRR